jgi:hypothetical protein
MANCSQPFTDISEFLREKQRDGEIHHEKNRENQSGRRYPIHVHGLPQLFACLDVEKRQGEKNGGEQQHHCVLHAGSPSTSQYQAGRISLKNRFRSWCIGSAGAGTGIRAAMLPWPHQKAEPRFILSSDRFEYRKEFLNKS